MRQGRKRSNRALVGLGILLGLALSLLPWTGGKVLRALDPAAASR